MAKRLWIFLFCTIPFWFCCYLSTNTFASRVEYDEKILGSPLFHAGGVPVYWPFKIFSWYGDYARIAPDLMTGIPFYWVAGVIFSGLFMYLCRPRRVLDSHGSARWADYRDLLKMDLISSHGVVVGLYDPSWKRGITSFVRKLDSIRKEKVSFAEMAYDRRQDRKIDRLTDKLPLMRARYEDMSPGPKKKALAKSIKATEAYLADPPSYDPRKEDPYTIYPYVWVAKKAMKLYSRLPHFYLRDDSNKHLAVVAPTRSGKGVGLIVPTLLGGWTGSCIVNDIKSENWGITAGYRKRMGQTCIKFEPTSSDGSSARWNPVEEIPIGDPMEVSMAQNIAAIVADFEGKGKPDHWVANASNVIMAVILHLKYAHFADPKNYPAQPSLSTVANFLKTTTTIVEEDGTETVDIKGFIDTLKSIMGREEDEKGNPVPDQVPFCHVPPGGLVYTVWDTKQRKYVKKTFTQEDLRKIYPDASILRMPGLGGVHPIVYQAFSEIVEKPDNELGSIVSTANTALKEYLDPVLARNTSVSDFCIDDIMNYKKPVSLYLVTPPSDLLRLAPIFRLFFEMMVRHHARRIGTYENGQAKTLYKHKCLFLMDEFSSLGNLQSFAATLSYIAGYGMKVFLINQGMPQINGIYGKDNQILMNCHIKIFYAPNDVDTAKYAESQLGNKTIVVESESDNSNGGFFARKNYSRSQTGRALMTADELMRLGDQEIIMASGNPPVLTDKIKYYENRFFTKKLKNAPVVSDIIRTDPDINAYPERDALIAASKRKGISKDSYIIDFHYKKAAETSAAGIRKQVKADEQNRRRYHPEADKKSLRTASAAEIDQGQDRRAAETDGDIEKRTPHNGETEGN